MSDYGNQISELPNILGVGDSFILDNSDIVYIHSIRIVSSLSWLHGNERKHDFVKEISFGKSKDVGSQTITISERSIKSSSFKPVKFNRKYSEKDIIQYECIEHEVLMESENYLIIRDVFKYKNRNAVQNKRFDDRIIRKDSI